MRIVDVLLAFPPTGLSATGLYVAPRNAIEEQIAKACCDLLGMERMGIHDNFFDSGGHSLLAMRLMTWVRRDATDSEQGRIRHFDPPCQRGEHDHGEQEADDPFECYQSAVPELCRDV